MPETLEQLLDGVREELPVLKKHGELQLAASLEDLCERVAAAAEDFLVWLSEDDAMLRSGHQRSWLRRRFVEWEDAGHARIRHGRREYRQVVVPQRVHLSAAREAGRAAAQELAG